MNLLYRVTEIERERIEISFGLHHSSISVVINDKTVTTYIGKRSRVIEREREASENFKGFLKNFVWKNVNKQQNFKLKPNL